MTDYRQNPFQHAGLWYFYDETGDTSKPYPSQRAALRALLGYMKYLEDGPTLWQRMRWEWYPKFLELLRA